MNLDAEPVDHLKGLAGPIHILLADLSADELAEQDAYFRKQVSTSVSAEDQYQAGRGLEAIAHRQQRLLESS